MPRIKCERCDKEFYATPSRIKNSKHYYCSIKCNVETRLESRPEANCTCFTCGKNFRTNPAYIKRRPYHHRFCSIKCFNMFKHKDYGSISDKKSSGYFKVKGSRSHERYHRYIMEKYLGRKLTTNEHVHHLNGNKLDNRLENLIVLDASTHHRLHRTPKGKGGIWTKCIKCGKPKWMAPNYIMHAYAGDRNKVKFYKCKNCGGGGRRDYKALS